MGLLLTIDTNIKTKISSTCYIFDKLKIGANSNEEQIVWPDHNVNDPNDPEPDGYDPKYYFVLEELSFNKQMYHPGEINARIHISRKELSETEKTAEKGHPQYHLFTLVTLTSYFKGCNVTLTDIATEEIIAKGYKIKEISAEYTSEITSMYLNLKMYSPDYELTKKIGSKAYVAKRLGRDILKAQSFGLGKDYISIRPENGLFYKTLTSSDTDMGSDTSPMEKNPHGGASRYKKNEYIQPYLVQYNESFWDMLIRTANRWGEFVYYEEGMLILGREVFSSKVPDEDNKGGIKIDSASKKVVYKKDNGVVKTTTTPELFSYKSLSYVHTPDNKSIDDEKYSKAVVTPDYLELMGEYNHANNHCPYITASGDLDGKDAVFTHRIMQSLVSMKGNVFDWTLDVWPAEGELRTRNSAIRHEKNEAIRKHNYVKNSDQSLDSPDWQCRQFTTYVTYEKDNNNNIKGLTNDNYQAILKKEIEAEQNVLCLDLGAEYQHLRLGDTFTIRGGSTKYLVIGVECKTDVEDQFESTISKDNDEYICTTKKSSTPSRTLHFYIHAVQEISGKFYPPMLPTGHIRYSGPQRGEVTSHRTDDPKLSGRYRVSTAWDTGTSSPWLRVARDSQNAVWKLEVGAKVLLDYDDGNVELPYIVGVLQDTVASDDTAAGENNRPPRKKGETKDSAVNGSALFNNMDLTTDAGHAIRLTDREGGSDDETKGGFVEFESSFIPIWGMIESQYPGCKHSVAYDGEDSKYYEGGMELTDKFGVYSIKASTNKRNITIKSPWGDVCLNAFTGITISAPNGDVKIQGKNVSIEAGNNVSIVSGKNITNSIVGCSSFVGKWDNKTNGGPGESLRGVGSALLKSIVGKALQIVEISFIRDFLETIIRPIQGAMTIQSNRYMLLGAGFKKADSKNGVNNPLFNNDVKADAWLSSHSLYKLVRENILFRTRDDEVWGPGDGLTIGAIKKCKCDGDDTNVTTSDV